MAYLLDSAKNSLGTFVIPTGASSVVTSFQPTLIQNTLDIGSAPSTSYRLPPDRTLASNRVLKDANGDGVVSWSYVDGGGGGGSEIGLYPFIRLTGILTNYNVESTDCVIDVVSDTFNTITLPFAAGLGGKMFIINRSSNNDAMTVVPQSGDNIDGFPVFYVDMKDTRLLVVSDNILDWFIV
jgi:hypothetical protein